MKKHSSDRWKVKRRVGFRELTGVTHYIFCEGEKTEPNYFRSFEKLIKSVQFIARPFIFMCPVWAKKRFEF